MSKHKGKGKDKGEKIATGAAVEPLGAIAQEAATAVAAVVAALSGTIEVAVDAAQAYGKACKSAGRNMAESYLASMRALYAAWSAGRTANVDWPDHAVQGAKGLDKIRAKRSRKAFVACLDLEDATGDGYAKIKQMIALGEMTAKIAASDAPELDLAGIPIPGLQNIPRCYNAKEDSSTGHNKDGSPTAAVRQLVADLQSGACRAETGAVTKRALDLGIAVNGGNGKAKKSKANCTRCSYLGALIVDMLKHVAGRDHGGDFDKAVKAVAKSTKRDVKTLKATLDSYVNGGKAPKKNASAPAPVDLTTVGVDKSNAAS
jgi:hypothetical protein